MNKSRSAIGVLPIVGVILLVSMIVLSVLGLRIREDLQELRRASSDNNQWTLAQLEVDVLKFNSAVLVALRSDQPDLEYVRRRFDVLYSRVDLLSTGGYTEALQSEERAADGLKRIQAFLEDSVSIIDGDDAGLHDTLSDFDGRSVSLRDDARLVSISGIKVVAIMSDRQRSEISALIEKTTGVLGIMFLALTVALLLLIRQRRIADQQSQAHRETSGQLASVIGVSLDAILIVDDRGMIIDINGAAEEVFGYPRAETVGQRMSDLILPERFRDAHENGMERFRKTGVKKVADAGLLQLTAINKDGREFPIEASISTAQQSDRTVFVSYIRDISDRVTAQTELVKARDDALAAEHAKSNFIAMMSHEMRTPLNGVIGNLDLLGHTSLEDRQTRLVKAAMASSEILLHHVNDVLDLSKLDADRMELAHVRFEPGALIDEVIAISRPLTRESSTELRTAKTGVENISLFGDVFRVRQILLNLVSNAIKFTSHGSITIAADIVADDQNRKIVEFRVVDTGLGIEKDLQSTIFDEFVTADSSLNRRTDGAGLGLALCKRLVGAMSGEIGVKSAPGKGSTFWFRVPFELANGPATSDGHASDHTDAPQMRIGADFPRLKVLVVEDNDHNRTLLCEMLAELGVDATTAANGAEACVAAEQRRFDLILMDVSMPVMDGPTAARTIRSAGGPNVTTPIIAVTAHVLQDQKDLLREANIEVCLSKPIRLSTLKHALACGCGQAQTLNHGRDVIDQETIDELFQVLGDEQAHARVVRAFEELNVCEGWSDGEIIDRADEVHRLAGTAAMFGLTGLHRDLARLEEHCRSGNAEAATKASQDVVASLASSRELFQAR